MVAMTQDDEIKAWCEALVAEFATFPVADVETRFNNLTRLGPPCQLYAILVKAESNLDGVIVVLHDPNLPHGRCMALVFENLSSLAESAELLDGLAGTGMLPRNVEYGGPIGLLAAAAIQCGDVVRQARTQPRDGESAFTDLGKQVLGTDEVTDAIWRVRLRRPLSSPREVLNGVMSAPPPAATSTPSEATVVHDAESPALATFCDPLVTFGGPLFPSTAQVVLRSPWLSLREQRVVHSGLLGNVPFHVFDDGQLVLQTAHVNDATALFNQFMAALHRSGVHQRAVSRDELMELKRFDPGKGGRSVGVYPICRRNRLALHMSFYDGVTEPCVALPSAAAAELCTVANTTMQIDVSREQSMRLLTAISMLENCLWPEAFVVAWSVIESVVGARFVEEWGKIGRGNRRVQQMEREWPVSHQIDLLVARCAIASATSEQLHRLRKLRNEIVHNLRRATEADAAECAKLAGELADLPRCLDLAPFQKVYLSR